MSVRCGAVRCGGFGWDGTEYSLRLYVCHGTLLTVPVGGTSPAGCMIGTQLQLEMEKTTAGR